MQHSHPSKNPKPEIKLREYQTRIIQKAKLCNTLVVLPTGAGKTLIAAETIVQSGTPAVFFVPTVMLVTQQQHALLEWTHANVQPYCGKKQIPASFDILVTTPKAFEMAQQRSEMIHLQWPKFKTVVFDEVHHVIKQHPYRHLALSLRASGHQPRLLGLTASYTYAVEKKDVKLQLSQMCAELRITNLMTADKEELKSCGYHALGAQAEKHTNLEMERPHGVLAPKLRKPHMMLQTFLSRVIKCQSTTLSYALTQAVLQMETFLSMKDYAFEGPLMHGKGVRGWVKYAHDKAVEERKKMFNSLLQVYEQMEYWYESLRMLVTSWEEDEYAAVMILRMGGLDQEEALFPWPDIVQRCVRAFWDLVPSTFERLERLKTVLMEKVKEHHPFRGLIFVQQRITTHALAHFINNDKILNQYLETACLYSQNGPISHCKSLCKSESMANLASFASGKVNVLLTTVVAEEGMDIPAANCVIRFDGMHTAVSLVQGRGRARQEKSSFVVLREMPGRSTDRLQACERQQRELIKTGHVTNDAMDEKLVMMQKCKEVNAEQALYGKIGGAATALGILNMFCQKTKVPMLVGVEAKHDRFETRITYASALRCVVARGVGRDKKSSKQAAAAEAIRLLKNSFRKE